MPIQCEVTGSLERPLVPTFWCTPSVQSSDRAFGNNWWLGVCWSVWTSRAAHTWFIFFCSMGWMRENESISSVWMGESLPWNYCILTAGRLPSHQNTLISTAGYSQWHWLSENVSISLVVWKSIERSFYSWPYSCRDAVFRPEQPTSMAWTL